MTNDTRFKNWLKQASGDALYPSQIRFACEPSLFQHPSPTGRGQGEGLLVDVPTGLGKTAMVVLGWLRQRLGSHRDNGAEGDVLALQ